MNFEKYENTLDFPKKPVRPQLKEDHTASDVMVYYKDLKMFESDMCHYHIDIQKYREHENDLFFKFKKDALKKVGLDEHPNKNKIFDYAWDRSHSEGYEMVFFTLKELSDLIHIVDEKLK